jgi:heptosyltransferase-1
MSGSRILVVRLGAMGDIIHALPAVASLKQAFPGSTLVWAVESKWRYLLRDNPSVDEVVEVDRHNFRAVYTLWRRLREKRFDIAVDFQGLIKSALVASFGRPDKIYGYDRSSAREKLACLFYSGVVKPSAVHVVDRNLQLAATAGASSLLKLFPLPAGEPQGELPSTPFVLANPLAGWESKQWPIEYYSDLAARLQRELDLQLVVNGADTIHVHGAWPHASGISGVVHATRRALAVVGVDSGPMHLAAALGRPGVAIFGPTDPARNGPYGDSITVLRAPDATTTYKRGTNIDPSMRAITPERVMHALKQRLVQAVKR